MWHQRLTSAGTHSLVWIRVRHGPGWEKKSSDGSVTGFVSDVGSVCPRGDVGHARTLGQTFVKMTILPKVVKRERVRSRTRCHSAFTPSEDIHEKSTKEIVQQFAAPGLTGSIVGKAYCLCFHLFRPKPSRLLSFLSCLMPNPQHDIFGRGFLQSTLVPQLVIHLI